MILELPYPPSVNNYWRARIVRGELKFYVQPEGIKFRKHVIQLVTLKRRGFLAGKLRVNIVVTPPDQRRRDLDNVLKALLDALQHAGVYEDDRHIDDLRISRAKHIPGAKAMVTVSIDVIPPELFVETSGHG